MNVFVDATTLIALGQTGELDLLLELDGTPAVLPAVRGEVTSEPARTNLDQFVDDGGVLAMEALPFSNDCPDVDSVVGRAFETLGETEYCGDVELVAATMFDLDAAVPNPGVISDDRRVRTICRGIGATVTETVGVVVRAVKERGLSSTDGKDLIRRIDGHGLHMTGELREKAYELVGDAASE